MLQIEKEFLDFLNLNFRLEETKVQDRVRIYASDDLKLQIIQDYNNWRSIEIAAMQQPERWFDLPFITSLMLKNDDFVNGIDFNRGYSFLIENYEAIKEIFSPKNYVSTEQALTDLQDRSAEIRFGFKKVR